MHAFVSEFDLVVEDPQIEGMGVGDYDSAKFKNGWAAGNAVGYSASLSQEGLGKVLTLPTAEIQRIWRWNLDRQRRQAEIGEGHFVPRIFYLDVGGNAHTAVAWPDAIPSLLPKCDYLFIGRTELAPRRFFQKRPDTVLVEWEKFEALIRSHSTATDVTAFLLNYQLPPPALAEFVRDLPPSAIAAKGVAADSVLDAELVSQSMR